MLSTDDFQDAIELLNDNQEALRQQVSNVIDKQSLSRSSSISIFSGKPDSASYASALDFVDVVPVSDESVPTTTIPQPTAAVTPPLSPFHSQSIPPFNDLEDGHLSDESPFAELERLSVSSLKDHASSLTSQIRSLLEKDLGDDVCADNLIPQSNTEDSTHLKEQCEQLESLLDYLTTRIALVQSYKDYCELTQSVVSSGLEEVVGFEEYYDHVMNLYSSVVAFERDFNQNLIVDGQNVALKLENVVSNLNHDSDLIHTLKTIQSRFQSPTNRREVRQSRDQIKSTRDQAKCQSPLSPTKKNIWKPVFPKQPSPKADVLSKYNKYEDSKWENSLRKSKNNSPKTSNSISRRTKPHVLQDQPVSPLLAESRDGRVMTEVSEGKKRRESLRVADLIDSKGSKTSRHQVKSPRHHDVESLKNSVSVPMPRSPISPAITMSSIYPEVVDQETSGVGSSLERIRLLKSLLPN
ncbi:hypothetical protein P9112_005670 [Eukaryota sp. TZLM1-RC]